MKTFKRWIIDQVTEAKDMVNVAEVKKLAKVGLAGMAVSGAILLHFAGHSALAVAILAVGAVAWMIVD